MRQGAGAGDVFGRPQRRLSAARYSLEGCDRRGRHFCGTGWRVVLAGGTVLVWRAAACGWWEGRSPRSVFTSAAPRCVRSPGRWAFASERIIGLMAATVACAFNAGSTGLCALRFAWRGRDGQGLSGHYGTSIGGRLHRCRHPLARSSALRPWTRMKRCSSGFLRTAGRHGRWLTALMPRPESRYFP